MRVAIAGAGAVGRAYAVLVSRAGHHAALWSPRGEAPGELVYEGVVEGRCAVEVLHDDAALVGADVVLVAIPATAYADVIPRMAPHLRSSQFVFVSGALSLAPLWLAELAATNGQHPVVAASGTTVATARRRDQGVAVMTVRSRVGIAALPVSARADALEKMRALFGDRFDAMDNVLAVTLANINPVAHAGMAIANFTRIERGEAWPQYHYLTPAVARLVEAMDGERKAIAQAFGFDVTSIEAHFQRSFDVPQGKLADIAAELHRRRGGPPGPTTLDTRFVQEDVPFGLVFNAALASLTELPTPATDAAVTLLSTLYARDFRTRNPLLDALGLGTTSRDALLARCSVER
jgi:opine dehydrogenase